jgi:hypothetical protein
LLIMQSQRHRSDSTDRQTGLRLVFALASVTIVTRRVPIEFVTVPERALHIRQRRVENLQIGADSGIGCEERGDSCDYGCIPIKDSVLRTINIHCDKLAEPPTYL